MNMKKLDAGKILPVASAVLGILGFVVSNAISANEKKTLKAEVIDEVVQTLKKEN